MHLRSFLTALCLTATVFAGCDSSDDSEGGGDSSQGRGGTLTMAWSSAGSSIDPAVAYDMNWGILFETNDALVTWKRVPGKEGHELVPNLARSLPEPTDGGRTYAFTLRPGIKYSDGGTVKPSDFVHSLERQFKVPGPGGHFYAGIVGADRCAKQPKSCDLSKGIVADDQASTLTFKLTGPDPEFLSKLALPFSMALPGDTPAKDTGTKPLPATGPYMIDSYSPGREIVIVRNPRFKEWSEAAHPDGRPDRVEIKLGVASDDAARQVSSGEADWMLDVPPAGRLAELAERYPKQLHINPTSRMDFMALNTRVPPFDDVRVRRALNLATDRDAVVRIAGGPRLATPSCQILPPTVPGYEAYCPYTKNPGGKWMAPDMEQARRLVEESGTKGMDVTLISTTDEQSRAISLYFVSLLRKLGYEARMRTMTGSVQYPFVQDSRNRVQISYSFWIPDYPAPSSFLAVAVGCAGFVPNSTASPNLSGFCDDDIQALTERALAADGKEAERLWMEVDHRTTDEAPWVSLFSGNKLDFVSERVSNFIYQRALNDFLWSQASVK